MTGPDLPQPRTRMSLEMLGDARFHGEACESKLALGCTCGMAQNLGYVEAEAVEEESDVATAARLTAAERARYGATKTIFLAVYDGVPGGDSPDDPTKLRRMAEWLDRIDDATDAALAAAPQAHISEHRVGRTLQDDLRRIAEVLSHE